MKEIHLIWIWIIASTNFLEACSINGPLKYSSDDRFILYGSTEFQPNPQAIENTKVELIINFKMLEVHGKSIICWKIKENLQFTVHTSFCCIAYIKL